MCHVVGPKRLLPNNLIIRGKSFLTDSNEKFLHAQLTLILREDYPEVMVKVYRVDGREVAPQNTGRRRLLQTRFVNSSSHVLIITFGGNIIRGII